MIAREDDRATLFQKLAEHKTRLTSPIAMYEAALALARKRETSQQRAYDLVDEFLELVEIAVTEMPADIGYAAISTHEIYGRGSSSPAKLNMGDCFAYAMAKRLGATLLYKGDDFAHTDLA